MQTVEHTGCWGAGCRNVQQLWKLWGAHLCVPPLLSTIPLADRLHADIVVSTRMNQYLPKGVLLEVLTHIRNVVEDSRAKFAGHSVTPDRGGR